MLHDLKEYFSFTRKDLRGIFVLLVLLLAAMITRFILPFVQTHNEHDFSEFERMVLAFEKSQRLAREKAQASASAPAFIQPEREIAELKLHPFPFDPNLASEEDFLKMGLNTRQVRNLQNFRSSGGRFSRKEDFRRIYSISDEEYAILEPYILIPEPTAEAKTGKLEELKPESDKSNRISSRATPPAVNINIADSLQLIQVSGIGPVFARRIIRYRDLLGGFHSADQLMEVFGMDSTRFQLVAERFYFDQSAMKTININQAEVGELTSHPYIDFYLAKSIVDQRVKLGKYISDAQLYGIPLMHDALYQKLIPYFDFSMKTDE